jgi:thiol-disulfide isomerase/thioredoxin
MAFMKVIKIGADWCAGCLVMKPRWAEIEAELPWLKTEYLDYDRDQEAVKVYGVESGKLPVFVFLDKDGKEFKRLEGEHPKDKLVEMVKEYKDK